MAVGGGITPDSSAQPKILTAPQYYRKCFFFHVNYPLLSIHYFLTALKVKCENRWGGKEFTWGGKKIFARPARENRPRKNILCTPL